MGPTEVRSLSDDADATIRSLRDLHVVVVNDFGHVNGGAAQVAITAAIGLRRRGLNVTFFCAVAPIDSTLVDAGVKVVCLEQPDILTNPSRVNAAVSGIWNARAKKALLSILRESVGPTVVHIHGWSKALSTSIYDAIAETGVASVSTQHEFFAVCPNGGLYDYRSQSICRLRPMSMSCVARNCDVRSYAHKAWRVVRQSVARKVSEVPLGMSDVIYLSEIARRSTEGYMGPLTRWHYVRNPIAIQPCDRAHAEKNAGFIFVGRLAPEKGADLFLDAAQRAGVTATVVGDGEMKAALQQKFPDARYTGWLQSGAVIAEIRAARALVFPSRWYETFGLTALEALAQGVPVIVADGTAAADVVVQGENGYVFLQGQVENLEHAMNAFGSDSHVRGLSERAHAMYWANPPTVEAHVDSLLGVFHGVLEGSAMLGKRRP